MIWTEIVDKSYRIIDPAHLPCLFNLKVNINYLRKWDVLFPMTFLVLHDA